SLLIRNTPKPSDATDNTSQPSAKKQQGYQPKHDQEEVVGTRLQARLFRVPGVVVNHARLVDRILCVQLPLIVWLVSSDTGFRKTDSIVLILPPSSHISVFDFQAVLLARASGKGSFQTCSEDNPLCFHPSEAREPLPGVANRHARPLLNDPDASG